MRESIFLFNRKLWRLWRLCFFLSLIASIPFSNRTQKGEGKEKSQLTCKLQTAFNKPCAPSVGYPSEHGRCSPGRITPGSWPGVVTIGSALIQSMGILLVWDCVLPFENSLRDEPKRMMGYQIGKCTSRWPQLPPLV